MSTPYRVDEAVAARVRTVLGTPLFDLLASAFNSYADARQRRTASLRLTRQVESVWRAWEAAGRTADDFTAALLTRLGDLDGAPPSEGWIVGVSEALEGLSTSAPPSTPARRTSEELDARRAERMAQSDAWRAANPRPRPAVALEDFTWVGSPVMRAWYLDSSKSDAWRAKVLDALRPFLRDGWTLEGVYDVMQALATDEPPADLTAPVGWLTEVAFPRMRAMEPNTVPRGYQAA